MHFLIAIAEILVVGALSFRIILSGSSLVLRHDMFALAGVPVILFGAAIQCAVTMAAVATIVQGMQFMTIG